MGINEVKVMIILIWFYLILFVFVGLFDIILLKEKYFCGFEIYSMFGIELIDFC